MVKGDHGTLVNTKTKKGIFENSSIYYVNSGVENKKTGGHNGL
jgi:hypothetical protein